MIKFVIGFIALIFVVLAVYVYTGEKSEEATKSSVTHNVAKEEATEAVPLKVASKKVTPSKINTPKQEVISAQKKKIAPLVENFSEMNDDGLATEKEYNPSSNQTSDEPISDKEWNSIEKQMIKSGQISQEGDSSASTENLGYDPSELAGKI